MICTSKRLRLCQTLILCCLAFIWGNSLLPGEISGAVSDWVGSILSRLFPAGVQEELPGTGLLRKLAHFTEFAALGFLLSWRSGMLKKKAYQPLLWGALAACIDETIQIFVPQRGPSLRDVCIDCGGVLTGMVLLYLGHTYLRRKQSPMEDN